MHARSKIMLLRKIEGIETSVTNEVRRIREKTREAMANEGGESFCNLFLEGYCLCEHRFEYSNIDCFDWIVDDCFLIASGLKLLVKHVKHG